jgi:hypothetical protein
VIVLCVCVCVCVLLSEMFSSSFHFTSSYRSLRQKSYPYRCGSISQTGVGSDLKRYFNFIFSCVLHNSFKIFECFSGIPAAAAAAEAKEDYFNNRFSVFCIALAEELFQSTTLQ